MTGMLRHGAAAIVVVTSLRWLHGTRVRRASPARLHAHDHNCTHTHTRARAHAHVRTHSLIHTPGMRHSPWRTSAPCARQGSTSLMLRSRNRRPRTRIRSAAHRPQAPPCFASIARVTPPVRTLQALEFERNLASQMNFLTL